MNRLPFKGRLDLERYLAFRHRVPIRERIAVFGAAVVALTVVIFGLLVYFSVEQGLVSQQDDTLTSRGDTVWRAVATTGRVSGGRFFFPPVELTSSSESFVQLLGPGGESLGSTGRINGRDPVIPPAVLASTSTDRGRLATIKPSGGPLTRVYLRAVGSNGYVLVGQPLSGIDGELRRLRLFLIGGALMSLVGAAIVSWLVAGRALRPLDAMATTAEDIGRTQDLSRRLPEGGVDDEVGRLQRSFNQMLRQLEDAYHRLQSALVAQRRFVADASHELRSPLTTIRGNVGLLLKRDDITRDDRLSALNDIASESERMSRMVQDLLTLARGDAGYHLEKVPVDLEPIAQEVSRQAQTLQPSRRVELQDGMPAVIDGNADALKQLLWILVDNAMKHTPDGGKIRVMLDTADGTARLAVADDGPGIPDDDLERIFERFYQADQARSGEGTGLGLAIARWIAQEHGGRVIAGNNPGGGAIFTVQLPAQNILVKS